ncbi:MAG TPA: hypothetical protein VL995_10235 [Cellvibrio sp.]|nr:hypothetical protein [Cellvibrio sp.]
MGTKLIEVTLDKAHRHAGRDYQPGQKIDVTLSEAKFLLNHKVIKQIPAGAQAAAERSDNSGE